MVRQKCFYRKDIEPGRKLKKQRKCRTKTCKLTKTKFLGENADI